MGNHHSSEKIDEIMKGPLDLTEPRRVIRAAASGDRTTLYMLDQTFPLIEAGENPVPEGRIIFYQAQWYVQGTVDGKEKIEKNHVRVALSVDKEEPGGIAMRHDHDVTSYKPAWGMHHGGGSSTFKICKSTMEDLYRKIMLYEHPELPKECSEEYGEDVLETRWMRLIHLVHALGFSYKDMSKMIK